VFERAGAPAEALSLLTELLVYSPKKRKTAIEIMAHPFFDELRQNAGSSTSGVAMPNNLFSLTVGLTPPATLTFCHRLALHFIPSRKGLFDHCTTNGWKERSSMVCTSTAVARTPLTPRSRFPSVYTLSLKKSRGLERLVCWTRSFLPTCRWMRSRPSLHHAIPRHLLRHAGPRPDFSKTFHRSPAVSFGPQNA
jgi:serine/threonine protein kinase